MKTLKVKDLLPLSHTAPSLVPAGADLRRVVEKMVDDPRTREVYVVDEAGRFVGVITLRRLARCVFASEVPDQTSPTALLELVSARTAGDLAWRKPSYVREEDPLERLLEVMFHYDVNEVPVVDAAGVIVGNLSALEILSAWLEGGLDPLAA